MLSVLVLALALIGSCYGREYYGKKLGALRNSTYGLSAEVYLVNSTHIQLVDFSVNKPSERLDLNIFFSTLSEVAFSDDTYQVIKSPSGDYSKPTKIVVDNGFNKARFILKIPGKLKQWQWIGVASEKKWFYLAAVSLKDADPPTPFCCITSPEDKAKGIVGTWYNAGAGPIQVLDSKTLLLPRFTFEGTKPPDGWIFCGKGTVKRETGKKALIIGRDSKSLHCPLRELYSGERDLRVQLAEGQTVYDISYISVYCYSVGVNFGHVRVRVPDTVHVPAGVPPVSIKPLQSDIESWPRPIVAVVPPDSRSVIDGLTFTVGEVGGARARAMRSICEDLPLVWYVNERLTPEVWVQRGKTYQIKVQGGHDRPLYISSEETGGYTLKPSSEQRIIDNFAGADGQATGSSCEWVAKRKATSAPDSYSRFIHWKVAQLTEVCRGNDVGTLTWTVRQNTPDTVYYGSLNHYNMGGPIRVCNQITGNASNPKCL